MNPHAPQPRSLISLAKSYLHNRELIKELVWREVIGRYKGSMLGLLWSFITPILMLSVYTFVFSVVFKARWGVAGEESKAEFAIVLFVGLIAHGLLAEVLNRAPNLIINNVNYVKKVIFPLEILPLVTMGAALFHAVISIIILLCVFTLLNGYLHWTSILIPLVLMPLVFVILGISWFLASLGVYLRDTGQTITIITTVMLFLAPVFYPITVLPEKYQTLLHINPLTFIIEQSRLVLVFGHQPNWSGLIIYSLVSITITSVGYWWFQKTRTGFSDVL